MSLVRLVPSSSRSFAPILTRSAVYRTYSTQQSAPAKETTVVVETSDPLHQSPNVPSTWSQSQNPKLAAFDNARFEQVRLDLQPNSLSAMGLVAEDPIRVVHGRKAVCDGGSGALGHPKIFINLDKPGPKACGYCGTRFEQAHHDH